MHILLSVLIFCFLSLAAVNYDKMLAHKKEVNAEKVLPEREAQEEEVQLIEEEEFEPADEQGNLNEKQLELDQEKSEPYLDDVDISH